MPGFALSALFAVAIASKAAFAQPDPADPTPLTDKHYAYPTGIVSIPECVSFVALMWSLSFSALPNRLQYRCYSWPTVWLQHLQLHHSEPELRLPDHNG